MSGGFSVSARSGSSGCARSKAMRAAQELAPDNPRVKPIEAMCLADEPAAPAAIERWRAVVERFEGAPPARAGTPDWGHVEALTMLGESCLRRGEPVAARDALERALVLAPDYRQAQQLLQAAMMEITSNNLIQADKQIERIQIMAPNFLPAYVERARLCEQQGDLAKAGEQWREVLHRSAGTPLYEQAAAERIHRRKSSPKKRKIFSE